MKKNFLSIQLATIFVGSIVGAGLSSGRELSQFFSTYGYKSFIGLFICAISYILVGRMIVDITMKHNVKSYNEFIDLVCPKGVGAFTNIILTLFLLSSTVIILAGSSAVIHQYFGVPRWIGFLLMVILSLIILLRNTEGLFEVNIATVPLLVIIMSAIFISFIIRRPETFSVEYIQALPYTKQNWVTSSLVYSGFNIISIVGILVPLTYELRDPKALNKGIQIGSWVLTLVSFFIVFLMMVNYTYPQLYEIPILAVAMQGGRILRVGLLVVIWMEMFSSQISNIYSLTRSLESKAKIPYKKGVIIVLAIATPFSFIGFSKLVDILYPLYGVLSLAFVMCCIIFYVKEHISINSLKKSKQKVISRHKI
ncbi:transporter [Niameybacter massiliensis]|uniref:Transporter n=1 Tax=Holtiella tumoricola TaxID=3018743 RepID=A0AA42DRH3_9FIRM|nr:transporter [Holtiella tumoricola]MDA3733437.1 transporter [Holtiella tumoricola]